MSSDAAFQQMQESFASIGKNYLPKFADDAVTGQTIGPHGYVHVARVDGDDDFIAWSARHGKESDNPTPKLIRYMMRHRHTTPFETVGMVFKVKLPIFVARQWMRHRMGTFNEMSMRYEEASNGEFWLPEKHEWSKQAEGNHQGSSSEKVSWPYAVWLNDRGAPQCHAEQVCFHEYRERIAHGVSREQARSCLPVSAYTEFVWKIDLHNLFHFLKLRLDPHAQAEMREYAQAIEGFVKAAFPIAHAAWVDCVRDAITLTVQDQKQMLRLLPKRFLENLDCRLEIFPSAREHDEFQQKLVKIARILNAGELDAKHGEKKVEQDTAQQRDRQPVVILSGERQPNLAADARYGKAVMDAITDGKTKHGFKGPSK